MTEARNQRLSRLHNELNEFIGLRASMDLPKSTIQYLGRRVFKKRPNEPWWPHPAIRLMKQIITKQSRVLEFGSGSSTLWLAEHSGQVCSVESDSGWGAQTIQRLEEKGIENTQILMLDREQYFESKSIPYETSDIFIVDGLYRWKCIEKCLEEAKHRNITIYLDNSDSDKDRSTYQDKEAKYLARQLLLDFDKDYQFTNLVKLSGLISGELHSGEGMFLSVRHPEQS